MANDIIPLQFRQSRLNHLPCGNGGAAGIVNSATNLSSSYIVALLLLLLIHSSDECSSFDSVLKIEKKCNFFVKSISRKFREIGFTKKAIFTWNILFQLVMRFYSNVRNQTLQIFAFKIT